MKQMCMTNIRKRLIKANIYDIICKLSIDSFTLKMLRSFFICFSDYLFSLTQFLSHLFFLFRRK